MIPALLLAVASIGQLGIVPEQSKPSMRVLVFGAEWCAPCKALHAEIERELFKPALGWREHVEFIDIDTKSDETKHLDSGAGVPQVVIIENDKPVLRMLGRVSAIRLSHVARAILQTGKEAR